MARTLAVDTAKHLVATAHAPSSYKGPCMPQHAISTDNDQVKFVLASLAEQIQGSLVVAIEDEWGDIFIIEDSDFRALKFDEFYEQSKMRLSEPQYPVFNYIKAMLLGAAFLPCSEVLVLGLGGGSLVRALHHLNSETKITVVEIRSTVIELAYQHFSMPVSPNIQIVCMDAKTYIDDATAKVDMIFADLFWALKMDPLQSNQQFIESCRRQLHANGWLIINYELHADVTDPLLQILNRNFSDVLLCAIPGGNAVILAGSISNSGGMPQFYQRIVAIEARLNCKLDILGRKLQRVYAPQQTTK